jgi:hypothetical protein
MQLRGEFLLIGIQQLRLRVAEFTYFPAQGDSHGRPIDTRVDFNSDIADSYRRDHGTRLGSGAGFVYTVYKLNSMDGDDHPLCYSIPLRG